MKAIKLSIILILLTISVIGTSQTPAKSSYKLDGNTITEVSNKSKSNHDSTTTYTFITKDGNKLPVYKGKSGGLYVWVTSKKGIPYKKYIKL
jgi:hypothetical protein